MSTRRLFLKRGASALLLACAAQTGCKRRASREAVLRTIATGVALPAIRALPELDTRLVRAVEALPSAPSLNDLTAARAALAASLLAWERAYTFRSGPLVESSAFLRARFWPVRKSSFHELLLGEGAIDAQRVAQLGVDLKGLFALERLLWERSEGGGGGLLFTQRPERARALAYALASDVQRRSQQAASLLGDGAAFAARFAQAGQESVALLVNQLVETSEAIVTDRFERVLGLQQNNRLRPGELMGDFSQLTTELTVTTMRGMRALYLGAREDGLSVLVQQAAPTIDAHVRSALAQAVAASEALGAPLAQLVVRDAAKVRSARELAKALELAFKVQLPSALGVTLSIAAGDGD
jgi:predicted lipoprotein